MEKYKDALTSLIMEIYKYMYSYAEDESGAKIAVVDLVNEVLADMKIFSKLYVKYDELRTAYDNTDDPEEKTKLLDSIQTLAKTKAILEEQDVIR